MEPNFPITVGACIYCGVTGEKLSDEHIIPFGLEGQWILREASCGKHRDLTSAFERVVQRGALLALRTVMPMRTRHKRERPSTLPLKTVRSGETEVALLRAEEHPGYCALPVFAMPGPVSAGAEGGIAVEGFARVAHLEKSRRFRETTNASAITVPFPDLMAFCRMLAKIGYSFAVACEGLPAMADAPVLGIIFGDVAAVGNYIGCRSAAQPPVSSSFHEVSLLGNETELWANIRLFAQMGTPDYTVRLR